MTDKRYFVVRETGTVGKGKLSFAVEVGQHRQTTHEQRKGREHDIRIAYVCEIPDTMTLDAAVRLYEAGVRVKPQKADQATTKTLAQVLKEKREGRAAVGRK